MHNTMTPYTPVYIQTAKNGNLRKKIIQAQQQLSDCTLCPRQCHTNRLSSQTGICKTGKHAIVSSYDAHFGEEAPLVGRNGSGTIFFTRCNLLCNFCQNYDISHLGNGIEVTDDQLSDVMLSLQAQGCHNINLVTPSHVVPQILSALERAIEKGLSIPLVYNTSAYDRIETLHLLEHVVDIYMPDFKFWDSAIAEKTCHAKNYRDVACKALLEMHRQVGDLQVLSSGVAVKGLLVRHLVLPHGLAGTKHIMKFIAERLSPDTYVNIMPQYRPCGRAEDIKELSGHLSLKDYEAAYEMAKAAGLTRLDKRRRVFFMR